MSDFFDAIRRFLLDYLPKQRCLSKNTILSYRQTLNIFVAYMRDEIGIGAAELTFSRVDRDVILNFLTWLEMLMCDKVTHKKLIDSNLLFRKISRNLLSKMIQYNSKKIFF